MTTLADIFEQLTFGELAQFSIGGLAGEQVRKEDQSKVMSHINLGLKKLYERFWLSSKEAHINLYSHIQNYTLDKKFARTNQLSVEKYKYIIDSVYQPFQNDVLKIEQVFNEGGELMFLNDLTEPWSVFTPSYNQIQIPFPERENSLTVHYRASHAPLMWTAEMDPSDVEVRIPEGLVEALLLFVGYRAHASIGGELGMAESNNYLRKFNEACAQADRAGVGITTSYGNLKLDKNGWV